MAPPPPRPLLAIALVGAVNLAIFGASAVLLATVAVSGNGALLQQALQAISAEVPPELIGRLVEVLKYAPATLGLLACLMALLSFAGCCGAFAGKRCLLYIYGAFIFVMLAGQGYVVLYAAQHGTTIEQMAGATIEKVWDHNCPCVDGPHCEESKVHCYNGKPLVHLNSTKCQPCSDYLTATICHSKALQTGPACAAEVEGLMDANVKIVQELFIGIMVIELVALVFVRRIIKWSAAAEYAETDEESLLAEASRANRLLRV